MSASVLALAWTLLLAGVRAWALLRVQIAARSLVGPSWEAIAAALALVIAGVALLGRGVVEPPAAWPDALALLALELLLGSVLGSIVALPGWALCGAAEQAELELVGEGRSASLSTLLIAGSLAAALALGLHRPLLAALVGTYEWLPLGEPLAWSGAVELGIVELPALLARATSLALALATPVLLTRMIVAVGVEALGRGSDLDASLLAALAPGLRFAAASLALAASWSAYPHAWAAGLG